jgi:hypothetical protein
VKGIQIIGVSVGIYLILQVYINYKKNNYSTRRTVFMLSIWGILIVLFLNPSIMIYALPILSTEDFIMSVLVLSFLFIFLMLNDINNRIMENEKKVTELVQKLAIEDYFKNIPEGE